LKPVKAMPFKVNPIVVPTVWAGTELSRLFELDNNLRAGEIWFFSTLPGSESVAVEGAFRGYSINEIMKTSGAIMLGPVLYKKYGQRFPVLVKYLNAGTPLSVQVHPSGKDHGKTEMWHVLKTEKGAGLWLGLKKGRSMKQLKDAALKGKNTGAMLKKYSPKTGDTYFVPAGTVHALGKGSVILEVQQNAYTTYRLYDWGRKGRELHLKEAFASLKLHKNAGLVKPVIEPKCEGLSWKHLLQCEYFACADIKAENDIALYSEGGAPVIVSVISGKVALASEVSVDCEIESSQMAFVPYSYGPYSMKIKEGSVFILTEVR